MIALGLAVFGFALIFLNKKVGSFLYELQRPSFKFFFRDLINYESVWIPKFYRILVIILGVFFILGAIAFKFGPITVSL